FGGNCGAEKIPMNKLFLNWRLWRRIRSFDPDVICYVPSSSGTFNSFVRARMLKLYGRDARVILVSLQSRSFSRGASRWARHFRPDVVLVQSRESARSYQELGCAVHLVPSGVELDTYCPVSESRRLELRRGYRLPPDAFLLLHVGHINTNRGVSIFKELQKNPKVQVLLVGSTSTRQDEMLIEELETAGVRVLREFIPAIHEIYQMSDCYLFQVASKAAAIELPLSVLEAMACNLPVVTTRFGGLQDHFPEGDGLMFVDGPEEMRTAISLVMEGIETDTRRMVANLSWDRILKTHWQRYLR
ncbi:glycosyltransferase, partial [Candidatus Zixiibacteriota bacterium]